MRQLRFEHYFIKYNCVRAANLIECTVCHSFNLTTNCTKCIAKNQVPLKVMVKRALRKIRKMLRRRKLAVYIGVTNDPARRLAQHVSTRGVQGLKILSFSELGWFSSQINAANWEYAVILALSKMIPKNLILNMEPGGMGMVSDEPVAMCGYCYFIENFQNDKVIDYADRTFRPKLLQSNENHIPFISHQQLVSIRTLMQVETPKISNYACLRMLKWLGGSHYHYAGLDETRTLYQCKICSDMFSNVESFKIHVTDRHPADCRQFHCFRCSEVRTKLPEI